MSYSKELVMQSVEKHYVKWDKEKIAKFWDIFGTLSGLEGSFFIDWASNWMINEIKKFIPAKKDHRPKLLDIACGTGTLLGKAYKAGYHCFGIDLSEERIKEVSHKFKDIKFLVGNSTTLPYSSEIFDIIVSTQLIEHLLNEDVDNFFKETNRCLVKGGYLFITTRYNENLLLNYAVCPDCHAMFHIYQHLQKWDKAKITQILVGSGFRNIICRRSRCNGTIPHEPYKIVKFFKPLIRRFLHKHLEKKGLYLYAVAQKR